MLPRTYLTILTLLASFQLLKRRLCYENSLHTELIDLFDNSIVNFSNGLVRIITHDIYTLEMKN